MGGRLATCPDTCEVGEGEEADTELLREGDEVRAGLRLGPGPRHGQPQEAGHHQRLQWSGIRNMVSDDTRKTRDTKPKLVLSRCWAVGKKALHLLFFIHDESATSLRFFVRCFVVGIKTE